MRLNIFFEKYLVGILEESFQFKYEDSWLNSDLGFDISFALPRKAPIQVDAVKSFFSNILIEGDLRAILGKQHQIDINDHFNFLKEFGLDCAGALVIQSGDLSKKNKTPKILSWEDLDKKIDKRVPLATIDGGHFSLAGAQDKLSIIYQDSKVYLPTTDAPSTHILKPISNWQGVQETVYNEWFCMELAKAVGLSTPNVDIVNSKYPYYLIERYDRFQGKRLHQQDVCQALGIMASSKYENRGGPKIEDIYRLIQDFSQNKFNDLQMYIKWILFNSVIGNYDSHAKNISFLYKNRKWTLAPFYDLMSTAIYPGFTSNFSFSIGGQFKVQQWRRKHFEILETKLGLKSKTLNIILNEMIEEIILALPQVEYESKEQSPDSFIPKKIVDHIKKIVGIFDQRIL